MITSHSGGEQNSKSEYRNPKQARTQNPKHPKVRRIPFKQFCDLDLFSGFDIRASDFSSDMAELLAEAIV